MGWHARLGGLHGRGCVWPKPAPKASPAAIKQQALDALGLDQANLNALQAVVAATAGRAKNTSVSAAAAILAKLPVPSQPLEEPDAEQVERLPQG